MADIDGDGSGSRAPVEAASFGGLARGLGLAIATTCGGDSHHAHGPRDGGFVDAGPRALVVGEEHGLAHAAGAAVQETRERTRVVLILAEPEDWDGTAFVRDPGRPQQPYVDTRSGRAVQAGAVEGIRGNVVMTLVLPCQRDPSLVNVDLGRHDLDTPAKWRLQMPTPNLIHTFGTPEEPIPASRVRTTLRAETAGLLPSGQSSAPFVRREWVRGEYRHVAGGRIVNETERPQRVRLNTEENRVFVSGGEELAPQVLDLAPRESFEALAYVDANADAALCPQEAAVFDVQFEEITP